ncbi:MAG: helix-turn-helix transcriptional regulator [Coriobacteriia bacterium]|nr:helix-turn-helix transcriptional regulator [Coriobacteriia bacterium]
MENSSALTAEEVAQRLRISKNMVYELRNRGELAGYTVGRKLRFTAADVQRYVDSQHDRYGIKGGEVGEGGMVGWGSMAGVNGATSEGSEFSGSPTPGAFVVNGTEAVVDVLSNYLVQMDINMIRTYQSGYNGLIEMYRGTVDVTSAHLWDGEKNSYNATYVKRLIPGIPCVLIHIAYRMQGFIVAKGNPKGLRAWTDLLLPGVRIANHPRGSASRILLDEHLRLLKADPTALAGYNVEMSSPILLAGRVARNRVDVVIGTEKMAQQVEGAEFIPLHRERIDLVVRERDLDTLPVRALLNVLESGLLQTDIAGFVGFDTTTMGRLTML